jgi:hypothetical protein
MIGSALEPYPVIDTIEAVALTNQPGRDIVIWKIGVERSDSGDYAFPETQRREQNRDGVLNRGLALFDPPR